MQFNFSETLHVNVDKLHIMLIILQITTKITQITAPRIEYPENSFQPYANFLRSILRMTFKIRPGIKKAAPDTQVRPFQIIH